MPLVELYATCLRQPLFTGLLTLSGFMFAVHAFTVVNMKTGVYQTERYVEKARLRMKMDPKASLYGPLRRLSSLLLMTSGTCLAAAILQFALGLVAQRWAVIVCLVAACLGSLLTAMCLGLVHSNLSKWFDALEDEAVRDDKLLNGDPPNE